MKAWMITYQISKSVFKEIVVSDKIRAARYKLSVMHKCPLKNVKILESKVILDNQIEN